MDAGCYALALYQEVSRLGCDRWLVMRNPKLAMAIRRADLWAQITLRPDWGKDGEQVDANRPPEDEGWRWANDVVRPQVEEVGAGVYTGTLGINEPMSLPFDWLCRFERATCRHVQYGDRMPRGWRELPYFAFSAQVGHFEPRQVEEARAVFEIAAGSNWHAYLRERAKAFEPAVERYHACRWLEQLAPLIVRINPRHIFLIGECGTYYPPAETGIDLEREAAIQVELSRYFRAEAPSRGYQLGGVHCYGLGLEGDQREKWDLTGQIATLANTHDEEVTALEPPKEKRPPNGVGWWVWYVEKARHGRTPEQLAEVCRAAGISHLFIKAGDGANVWPQFAEVVGPLQAAGLRVYSWSYCYGDDWGAEADVALAALNAGSDGHVFDVEAECEGKGGSVLRTLEAVRERYPNAWLATAPLPVIDYHEPALYEASARYVDAFLPQFYWGALGPEYGDLDYLFGLWRDRFPDKALMPVGQAYGDVTPAEIAAFAERARDEGCPAVSFWEWAASSDEQWAAVAALSTQPESEPPAGPEPGVTWEQVALYSQWGQARVAAREDPRDGEAFAAHVDATGGDPSHLPRYGWPIS
jgi:hypothetical protein